jgi:molybdopterin converting factor subunit 1
MRVTVRLFARLREIAGRSEWTCEVPTGSTVADVWRALVAHVPSASALENSVSCAVNADFSRMDAVVADGDEIAFLPPVSGGAWIES